MIGIEESMYDDRLSIRQNLIDAGCDEEFVAKFMSLSEGQKSEMLTMLAAYRRSLLDNIHEDERKVYRLDYLVNKLKLD